MTEKKREPGEAFAVWGKDGQDFEQDVEDYCAEVGDKVKQGHQLDGNESAAVIHFAGAFFRNRPAIKKASEAKRGRQRGQERRRKRERDEDAPTLAKRIRKLEFDVDGTRRSTAEIERILRAKGYRHKRNTIEKLRTSKPGPGPYF